MNENDFITAYKQVFNDVTKPLIQEEVERRVREQFEREREWYWKQFCETKFQSIIHNLQRTIATLMVEKDDLV